MKNTVKLKSYNDVKNEYPAEAAGIEPGMMVMLLATDKVGVHANAGHKANFMIATEDALQGKGLGEPFEADSIVPCWKPTGGDEGYVRIATNLALTPGTPLTSNGDGTFKVASASAGDYIVAVAVEEKTGTHNGFVEVRFES